MVGVVSHLFEVVVLTTHAQTFLRVCHASAFRFCVSEDNVLELIHTRIGEHEGGVVFNHHWSGGNDEVSVLLKETLVRFAYFVCSHHTEF